MRHSAPHKRCPHCTYRFGHAWECSCGAGSRRKPQQTQCALTRAPLRTRTALAHLLHAGSVSCSVPACGNRACGNTKHVGRLWQRAIQYLQCLQYTHSRCHATRPPRHHATTLRRVERTTVECPCHHAPRYHASTVTRPQSTLPHHPMESTSRVAWPWTASIAWSARRS